MAGPVHARGIMLKHYRRRVGFSQEQLAERAGVSVRTIAGLEAGEGRLPRAETLRLIAEALQLSEEERTALLGDPPAAPAARRLLPRALPPLIGREQALADARTLLQADDTALLTITGPAGVGKTHFATELARSAAGLFRDGCVWIDLAHLTAAADVVPLITQRLGIRSPRKVPDVAVLVTHLQTQHWLLVFDNCEHLLHDLANIVAELLARCPQLLVMATSRAPLRLSMETVFSLPPLATALPGSTSTVEELRAIPAVALFLRTVRQRQPALVLPPHEIAAVAAVCVRMDGLPLAIQLAAAHCRLLAPSAILQRLDHYLALAAEDRSDLPERHRSLQAALTWSYALLSPPAQTVLQVASVFVGGVTVEMLVAICQAEQIDHHAVEHAVLELLELHLIAHGQRGRLTLFATVRSFAYHALLATSHAPRVVTAYHDSMLATLQRLAEHYGTEQELTYLTFCDEEASNIEALLSEAEVQERHRYGLQVAVALAHWWELRGLLARGRRWFTWFLTGAQQVLQAETPGALGQGFLAGATLAYAQGDYDQARTWLAMAEPIVAVEHDRQGHGLLLLTRGGILEKTGDLESAAQHYERALALFQQANDQRHIGRAHLRLGNIWYLRQQLATAERWYRSALARLLDSDDLRGASGALGNLANIALMQGDLESAEQRYHQALDVMVVLGDLIFITKAVAQLGQVARKRRQLADAERLSRQAYALYHASGYEFGKAEALRDLGYVYHSMQRPAAALEAFQASLELFRGLSSQYGIGLTLAGMAHALFATTEKPLAYHVLLIARQLLQTMGVALDQEDQALWTALQVMRPADHTRVASAPVHEAPLEEALEEIDLDRIISQIRSAHG